MPWVNIVDVLGEPSYSPPGWNAATGRVTLTGQDNFNIVFPSSPSLPYPVTLQIVVESYIEHPVGGTWTFSGLPIEGYMFFSLDDDSYDLYNENIPEEGTTSPIVFSASEFDLTYDEYDEGLTSFEIGVSATGDTAGGLRGTITGAFLLQAWVDGPAEWSPFWTNHVGTEETPTEN